MVVRRLVIAAVLVATAACSFTLGIMHSRRADAAIRASYDAKLDALRRDLGKSEHFDAVLPAGTSGRALTRSREQGADTRMQTRIVEEVKKQLQNEMGLLPLNLLRDRRSSFVELYSYDNLGKTNYGTAGYLGRGYFITVKHAVVALKDDDDRQGTRKITSIKIMFHGKEVPAKVVDAGDADVEVHSGDWAILKTRELDLPALRVDSAFAYEFAEPIFRLGNDYSKGIILSTGYIGQHTANGLVTSLTDGHPGVSGGGVLDQRGDLVGIPIGRMQGDYRFSFILPLRAEMFRKVPAYEPSDMTPAAVATVENH